MKSGSGYELSDGDKVNLVRLTPRSQLRLLCLFCSLTSPSFSGLPLPFSSFQIACRGEHVQIILHVRKDASKGYYVEPSRCSVM